jgi:hypothetical protein
VPDLELRDWRRYAESIKKHAAVRLSSALATRVQELHRAAGLEHAAPTDASACYFGKILQREAQSECGITNWYRSLHREGSQQIKNSTRERGNPLTVNFAHVELRQRRSMQVNIAPHFAST